MKKNLKSIIDFATPYKWIFIVLFVCIISTTFLGALYPYIFGQMIDEVFYEKNINNLYKFVLIYGAVFILNQLLHFALNMSWSNLMTKFLFDIRKLLFKKVMSLNGKELSNIYSGDIVYRMNYDVEQFMSFIHWNVFYFAASIINLLVSVLFIGYTFWPLVVIVIIATPITVYISSYFSRKVNDQYKVINDNNALLHSWLFEIIKGMSEIRFMSSLKRIISLFLEKTRKIIKMAIKINIVEVKAERINSAISLLWQIVFYCSSAYFIFKGYMTLGGFTACVGYFSECVLMYTSINNHIINISNNMSSVDRVFEILEKESEQDKKLHISIEGDIEFKDVCCSYDANKILNNLSFSIRKGEHVAIVGRSGEGKTTIANLLMGFLRIDSGHIYINGYDIEDFSVFDLRQQVGIVNQDIIMFDGTVRYNLIFSNHNDNDGIIFEVLKQTGLYDYIITLPHGLDTIITGDNCSLSGGQKQRIAIARLLLKNPKLLIFDEATSYLDGESEHIVRESWNNLCRYKTVISIAHRLSTVRQADRILVLDGGKIVANGTHDFLIKNSSIYRELFGS